MHDDLTITQCSFFSRPFGKWHDYSYVSRLRKNEFDLRRVGITVQGVLLDIKSGKGLNFQKKTRELITKKTSKYCMEERIRCRTARWKFSGPPAHVAARCVRLLGILKLRVNPAVAAGYLRALFNGWPTTARMRNMEGAGEIKACVFGCSDTAEDRIEHYCRCPIVWKFIGAPAPREAGIPCTYKGINGFFGMCKGMTAEEQVRAATAVHVTGKVVMYMRKGLLSGSCDLVQVFRLEWNKVFRKC
jgi:hypothetical protein